MVRRILVFINSGRHRRIIRRAYIKLLLNTGFHKACGFSFRNNQNHPLAALPGRKSKQKGNRGELTAKKLLEDAGHTVIRGKQKDEQDLILDGFGRLEVKFGKHVPKKLYDWLSSSDGLLIKRASLEERKPWLVVLPIDTFLYLLR